jgi:transposase
MVEAMVYILRVGCPWRDLPSFYGPWSSVYTRWRRWCHAGVWQKILALLVTQQCGQLCHVDATHIKVHQDGSSGGHQETQAIGATKGGLNTKVTALVDGQGRALQIAVAPGQCADVKAVHAIKLPTGKQVVADKGYDSDGFRQDIVAKGSTPCIPPKRNRTGRIRWHRGWYRKRHLVENFFQRIKRLRRIGTRYEKLSLHFLAFVQLAAVLDWLNRF